MKTKFLSFIVLFVLCTQTSAWFLMPTTYRNNQVVRTICQNTRIDESNEPNNPIKIPYLKCPEDGELQIIKATLSLSTVDSCPLQYGGSYLNIPTTCNVIDQFFGTDATPLLVQLCGAQKECVFRWSDLPRLRCGQTNGATTTIPPDNQKLDVTFICQTARIAFNPFNNNRYVSSFKKTAKNPFRKLSYNRLSIL